jgi:hypothetical protein
MATIAVSQRRWAFLLGVCAWVAVTALALALILFLAWYRRSADYPGALLLADQIVYRYSPALSIRTDSAYRSSDEVPAIYNWYSNGFHLGTEAHAQGGCVLLAKSFADFVLVERHMSVTLCDTPRGRMIFVMRTVSFRRR